MAEAPPQNDDLRIDGDFAYVWRGAVFAAFPSSAEPTRLAWVLLDDAFRGHSRRLNARVGQRAYADDAHVKNHSRAFKALRDAGLIDIESDPSRPRRRAVITLTIPAGFGDTHVPKSAVAEAAARGSPEPALGTPTYPKRGMMPEPDLGDLGTPTSPNDPADPVDNPERLGTPTYPNDDRLGTALGTPTSPRLSEVQELLTSNRSALPTTARPRAAELPPSSRPNGTLLERVLAVATSPASAHVLRAACTGQPDHVLATALESLSHASPDNAAAYLTATIRAIRNDRRASR